MTPPYPCIHVVIKRSPLSLLVIKTHSKNSLFGWPNDKSSVTQWHYISFITFFPHSSECLLVFIVQLFSIAHLSFPSLFSVFLLFLFYWRFCILWRFVTLCLAVELKWNQIHIFSRPLPVTRIVMEVKSFGKHTHTEKS